MPKTVKARRKYGANSLDLTIPAVICRKYDIVAGDVFEIREKIVGDMVELTYKKVYKYRSK
jgi:hypothetical protein